MDTAPKAGERTLDEVKKEVLRRAGQHSPFEGVRKVDVEKIVGGLTSLDKDHWAERWSAVGLEYEGKADALAKQGGAGKEIADTYMLAFNYCSLGRYPAATTPGKKEAYRHSLRMFHKAARYFDPPLRGRRVFLRRTEAHRISPGSRRAWRSRPWSCTGAAWTCGRRTASTRTRSCTGSVSRPSPWTCPAWASIR